jgi:hypothetical protein
MSDEEGLLMAKFGITAEPKTIYLFQGHKYDRLSDAVKYAEIVEASASQTESHKT